MKQLTWLVCFLLGTVLAADAVAQHQPNALNGLYLFRSYCLICHGNDGKTIGPISRLLKLDPADLTSENYQAMEAEDLAAIIAGYDSKVSVYNTEDSVMPTWGAVLSEEDLLDLAEYISHLNDKDLRYRGDTRRGRITFKRACASCHGSNGNGRGVLAFLFQIPMTDLAESQRMKTIDDEALINFIRMGKGPYMAPWGETLSDEEIVDVGAYVRLLAR